MREDELSAVTEAVLAAARVFVAVAAETLVDTVTKRRRAKVRRIVGKLSPDDRAQLVHVLGALAGAANDAPELAWSLGWFEGTIPPRRVAAPSPEP